MIKNFLIALLGLTFMVISAHADVHPNDYEFCGGYKYGFSRLYSTDSDGYGGATQICVGCYDEQGNLKGVDCILYAQ